MKELKYLSRAERLFTKRTKMTEPTEMAQELNQMPGSLIYTGEQHVSEVRLELIRFSETHFTQSLITISELGDVQKKGSIAWLNVVGLHEIPIIKQIGEQFNIHTLVLEDILNVNQRPVFDEHDDHYLFATKMLRTTDKKVISEQFSIVVGENIIITFQEKDGDVFDGVRNRLKKPKGRIRTRKSDYLAFALLDVIIDHFLAIIEIYGDVVNEQEVMLLDEVSKDILTDINLVKKEVNLLRRYIRPLKDAIIALNKSDSDLIEKRTRPFLKDLLEHTTYVAESIEVYRETINDNLNTYHTHMTNKLNDILKVLTIFSVIFIPLTFMAGIYGMNFEFIPELGYKHAYPIFWGVIIIIALSMLYYFKKRKWL
ncbi:magnesium/cobalt transporter CorA [Roseivirga sp.]|uniref:magnesium/cobalt transporter CorA n=1 Tax=Roseivirga sp. TaxID=1964215 RepID=UPI003B8B4B6A